MAEFLFPGTKGVKILASIGGTENEPYIGCHVRILSNLSLKMTCAADKDKELPPGSRYGEALGGEAADTMRKYIIETKEARDKLFTELAATCKLKSVVIMSGPCNTEDKPAPTYHLHGPLAVAGFAQWLRERGEFIIASPLMMNWQHKTPESGFSLVRAWMWTPTHSDKGVRHIEGSEYISGKMQSGLPFDAWMAYAMALGPKNKLKPFTIDELWG